MVTRKTAFLVTAALLFTSSQALAQSKKVIASASDLPGIVIELPAKPSVLAADGGPAFERIRDQVEAYAKNVLDTYDVRDVATEKELLSLLMQVAMSENRWDDALALSARIRGLEDKPAAKATSGLLTGSYARAAKAVGEDSPQFADRFQAELQAAVKALDWTVAQDALQATRGQFQLASKDLLIGGLQGGLDPNAAAQNNKVGIGIAAAIIGSRRTLTDVLPLKDRIFAVLDARVKSESSAKKEDRWTSRLSISRLPRSSSR
jgi:hypothetical protein